MINIKANVQLIDHDNLTFGCRDGYCGQCIAKLPCCETVTAIILEQ